MYICGHIDHISPFFYFVVIHHLLETIYSHHHGHTKVLCILYLLPHVAAALLQ